MYVANTSIRSDQRARGVLVKSYAGLSQQVHAVPTDEPAKPQDNQELAPPSNGRVCQRDQAHERGYCPEQDAPQLIRAAVKDLAESFQSPLSSVNSP
jgi:hypothetical protein